MTRMQKWQSYREEIDKQASISNDIDIDEKNCQKYKTEIDKINLAILSSINEPTASLQKGVSNVEINQKEISTDIANMFATINKTANTINQDTVESIFHVMSNNKIVDKNGKFIEAKLLESSNDFVYLKGVTKSLDLRSKDSNDEITNQLKTKYNNFTSSKQEHKVDNVISISKNSEKQASHYVFVISVSVSILLLVIVMALFITKVVLR